MRLFNIGNPFTTKKQAKEARELKLVELKSPKPVVTVKDAKLIEVYNKYMATETTKKAKSTITKLLQTFVNKGV
jgi:hypothetical protein